MRRSLFLMCVNGILVASAAWGAGCVQRGDRIDVDICTSDLSIPSDLDALRVVVLSAEREELRSATRELVLCPQDMLLELPRTIELVGVDEQDAWIVVQGLKGDVEVIRRERRASLTKSAVEQVAIVLEGSCLGVTCPLGQTCGEGVCAIVTEAASPVSCQEEGDPVSEEESPVEEEEEEEEGEEEEESPESPLYCPSNREEEESEEGS